jgi:HSP20 family protein
MNLSPWNPLQELDVVERRMRRLFDDLGFPAAPLPAADAYETEGEYVFELEVPGYAREELAVEVVDHTLVVKGARTDEKERADEAKAFRLRERLAHRFERRFELPASPSSGVTADFDAGVLTVRAPKSASAKPHRVEIAAR